MLNFYQGYEGSEWRLRLTIGSAGLIDAEAAGFSSTRIGNRHLARMRRFFVRAVLTMHTPTEHRTPVASRIGRSNIPGQGCFFSTR